MSPSLRIGPAVGVMEIRGAGGERAPEEGVCHENKTDHGVGQGLGRRQRTQARGRGGRSTW